MVPTGNPSGQRSDPAFSFRSDRLCLDFAATLMFRSWGTGTRELLGDGSDLAGWVVAAGLLPARPTVTAADQAAAIALREAIYRLASARAQGGGRVADAADVALLNGHGCRRPLVAMLGTDGSLIRSGAIRQVLATVARDAIELLGGPDAGRLRRCHGAGCTRLFVDRTRGATRVWCGMRECGNRVNAAAYRRRRKEQTRSDRSPRPG